MVEYIFGGLLLAMALFLIVAVLVQSGKDKKLSGSIAGGSETFFGKGSKSTKQEKFLATLTAVVAIVFMVVVITMYVVVS